MDTDFVPRLEAALQAFSRIRVVIYDGTLEAARASIGTLSTHFNNVVFKSYEELRELEKNNLAVLHPPSGNGLCAIFYTSGSTETPKGVPMKHKAVVAAG